MRSALCLAPSVLRRLLHARPCLGSHMDRLVSSAHRDEACNSLGARLRTLCRLYAVEDRVAVRSVERLEKGERAAVARKGGCKVCGDVRGACAVVRALPSSVVLRPLDLDQTGRLHGP